MTAMRLALVANTKSGASDRAKTVEDALRAEGAEVTLLDFDAVCDGRALDECAETRSDPRPAEGSDRVFERVVAAGGDGSLGPAGRLALRAGLPLAVIPIGTANSFARWMEIPLALEDAAALAARADARTRPAEVADADGRPFVNVAATGLSVLAAHRARPLKERLGPLAYAVGAARAAATGKPIHTKVVADGAVAWEGDAWQVLVAATGAFGGDSSTGGVDTDDGKLDVAIVPAGPKVKLLRRAYAMRQGRLVHEEEVRHERGADITLEVDGDPEFNVDGEVLDLDRARFTVLGRVAVVVP